MSQGHNNLLLSHVSSRYLPPPAPHITSDAHAQADAHLLPTDYLTFPHCSIEMHKLFCFVYLCIPCFGSSYQTTKIISGDS